MSCAYCNGTGLMGSIAADPCRYCQAGAEHRKLRNRTAINAYRINGHEPNCCGPFPDSDMIDPDDLQRRIDAIRANPPVPSTLPPIHLTAAPSYGPLRLLLTGMVIGAVLAVVWCKMLGVIP